MNDHLVKVLLVDDDEDDYMITREVLAEIRGWQIHLEWVATYTAALEVLSTNEHDICLVDYHLGAKNGLELLCEVRDNGYKIPVILLTGQGDREIDIKAMEAGASDYLVKGQIDAMLLERSIRYSIQRRQEEETKAKLEEQLVQSQKMESIGRLAGGVAHELNNLLTPILGYAQMSLALPDSRETLTDNLEQIEKAATRASNLVQQLLAFSRRQIIKPEIIQPNDLVEDMGKMLRQLIGEHIELVLLLDPELNHIKADSTQLTQILMNLTINAQDAMPDGGKVTIETSNTTKEEGWNKQQPQLPSGEYVVLSVSDNGIGMTEEVKAHIFEPFFTTKGVGQGTGLGLATCYGIANHIGGCIEVHSEVGQGATFKVYLPSIQGPVNLSDHDEISKEMPNGSETILLVEDEPLVRGMVSTMLKDQGYEVLQATNGEEALRVVQQHAGKDIQLLLTDVVMPQMGGIELAEKFGSLYPDTSLLLMSGYTEQVITERDSLTGGPAFLHKPFTVSALATKVREVIDGSYKRYGTSAAQSQAACTALVQG